MNEEKARIEAEITWLRTTDFSRRVVAGGRCGGGGNCNE